MNIVPKKRPICPHCKQEIREEHETSEIEKQLSLNLRNKKIDRLLFVSQTLTKRERNFLDTIRHIEHLSPKQTIWLDAIWNRIAPYIPQPKPFDSDDFP